MISKKIKSELLIQISRYFNNEYTKEEYAKLTEEYFTRNAEFIENTEFYRVFNDIVPDACIINLDEPGLTEEKKEQQFREQLEIAYSKLMKL